MRRPSAPSSRKSSPTFGLRALLTSHSPCPGGPDEPPVFDTDARPLLFRILCFRLLFFKFGVHFAA